MKQSAGWSITHRSFVNTWECDENNHWNVQFYFRAFQQASEVFALQQGGTNPGSASAECRHIRYHRELPAARLILVKSAAIASGDFAGTVVHRLEDVESGVLAATALDHPGYSVDGFPQIREADATEALPRGVSPGPHPPAETTALLESGVAFESHYSVIATAETDTGGQVTANALCSRLTDAAPHGWNHAGITGQWLQDNHCGRVAVEFALTRLAPMPAGTGMVLVSWVPVVEERTMVFRHQFEDIDSRAPLAVAQVRALVMDLDERRAVRIPDFVCRVSESA